MKAWLPIVTVLLVLAPAACRSPVPSGPPLTDAWLGRWGGPEGTYLQLARSGDHYLVEIQDLDGPRTFDGFADAQRIRFVRDQKTEYLSPGDGRATGMKWLADKKDCLMTRAGEGWCRH